MKSSRRESRLLYFPPRSKYKEKHYTFNNWIFIIRDNNVMTPWRMCMRRKWREWEWRYFEKFRLQKAKNQMSEHFWYLKLNIEIIIFYIIIFKNNETLNVRWYAWIERCMVKPLKECKIIMSFSHIVKYALLCIARLEMRKKCVFIRYTT